MAFKALFMWVLDVSSIELLYMVMSPLLNPSIKRLELFLHFAVEIEKIAQNLARKAQKTRNLASMLIQLCPSLV
jgi:hypothetical protein